MVITPSRYVGRATALSTLVIVAACGGGTFPPAPTPTPTGEIPTANVYVLPDAVNLGPNAFGDEAIVIFKGERMRWRNFDMVEHTVVADTGALPEFETTGLLAPGAEKSFVMNTVGTTKIHCAEHPQMTGTLIVQAR